MNLNLPSFFKYQSKNFHYTTNCLFQPGDYRALDGLARAGVFISKDAKGNNVLHVTFRGTDPEYKEARLEKPKGWIRQTLSFLRYVAKAYLDMQAYSDSFVPLKQAVMLFAKDPANNIQSIHLSGHSLGAAPVNAWTKDTQFLTQCNASVLGFTFGGVGGKKRFGYDLPTSLYQAVKNNMSGVFTLMGALKNSILDNGYNKHYNGNIYKVHGLSKVKSPYIWKKFGIRGTDYLDTTEIESATVNCYVVPGDIVPGVSTLTYQKQGVIHQMKNEMENHRSDRLVNYGIKGMENNPLNRKGVTSVFMKGWNCIRDFVVCKAASFHGMGRYRMNLESRIQEGIDDKILDEAHPLMVRHASWQVKRNQSRLRIAEEVRDPTTDKVFVRPIADIKAVFTREEIIQDMRGRRKNNRSYIQPKSA